MSGRQEPVITASPGLHSGIFAAETRVLTATRTIVPQAMVMWIYRGYFAHLRAFSAAATALARAIAARRRFSRALTFRLKAANSGYRLA